MTRETGTPPSNPFKRIAPVYDATREPLEPEVVEAVLRRVLSVPGATLLEVGVGTGRVAIPLERQGLPVTGVDSALDMLVRARSKGLRRLILGTARRLPLPDRSFDFVLFVHALDLLGESDAGLSEALRVGRVAVLSTEERFERLGAEGEDRDEVRALVRACLAELGGSPRAAASLSPPSRVADRRPPARTTLVLDEVQRTDPADRLNLIDQGADRTFLDVPPTLRSQAVAQVRSRLSGSPLALRKRVWLHEWAPAGEVNRPEGV